MMLKPIFLRLHRWIALAFALPLVAIIGSGIFLAFEPALKATTPAGSVTLERLEAAIIAGGPSAARGALFLRGYDGTVTIGGRGGQSLDIATALPREPGWMAGSFRTARRLHETLLLDMGWLVTASTIAMLAMLPFGLLLGWPRLRNTVSGWHRATAWVLLPLLVGSPLTGLALAFGISFTTPLQRPPGNPPPLLETLRLVAAQHDLGGLDFIRPVGAAHVVRVLDASGTATTYRAAGGALLATERNWPRVLHEGNWGGLWGSIANLLAGIAMAGLLGSGLFIWVRRKLMRLRLRRQALAAA